jgi:hypothetical protein
MVAAMLLVQGCALLLVGGAVAGATYGTVKYVNNTITVTHEVSLDKAWDAANATLKELQMPVTKTSKDGAAGKLEATTSKNQPVTIDLVYKTDKVTEISIRVGTFDNADNRSAEELIYAKMKARF